MANEGSMRKLGKDRHGATIWEVSLSRGYDPETGKRLRPTKRVHGTRKDAVAALDEMRREADGGLRVDAGKVTLKEWVDTYMESRRIAGTVQPETLDTQARMLHEVCAILGNIALKDVNPATVTALYPKLKARIEARNAGKCSTTTLHRYHAALKACMKQAVYHDLIMRNPCDRVEAPRVAKPDRKSLSASEAARLLCALDEAEKLAYADMEAKEERRRDAGAPRAYVRGLPELSSMMVVRIGLATGMRLGEVLTLQWGCVNLDAGTVEVVRGMSKTGRVKDTKTESSRRTIAIDGDTVAHLKRWRETQERLLSGLGIGWTDETTVACSQTGTILGRSTFNASFWLAFRKEHGFEGLRFHELRHTQATQLLANGVDVKTVQSRLGHSSATVTLDWYSHAIPENDRAAADMLGKLYREGRREPRIIRLRTA